MMAAAMRTWEDFEPGQVFDLGSRRVTREEIVDFARRWDPQPFHVDEEAAAGGPFGGLIASGWHSCAIWMRLYVDALLHDAAGMGSPGVEELRWLAPVRPDELVAGRLTVLETAPSSRRPDRGTVIALGELLGEDGEPLLSMRVRGLFGRRHDSV
jgi:acyl dehydratase